MVQLMLWWHPAGVKDNNLSAKVIIPYKQTESGIHVTHIWKIGLTVFFQMGKIKNRG